MLRRSRYLQTILAATAVLAGCGDPTGPAGETYALRSIGGDELPAPYVPDLFIYRSPSPFEAIAGSLTLRPDGTLTETMQLRCRNPLPVGFTDCEVGDGRNSREGRYSREDQSVVFDNGAEFEFDPRRARFPATFEANAVTIYYGSPAFPVVYKR
jgi:hypothetical protein